MNRELKICKNCQSEFTIEQNDIVLYEKIELPLPQECFYCRMQHMSAFWMFGKFKKRKSDLSEESLITILPKESRYPIYSSREWFSDAWNPADYGKEYDSNRSFFEQFKELQEQVPRPHQTGTNNTNCDWCDDVWDSKNCYLSRALLESENLSYCYRVINCKDSLDIVYCYNTQQSYDVTFGFNCFNVRHSFNIRDCIGSAFLYDCRNVQNCFMCWNLRNKQYCISNKQYTKEEYEIKIKDYNLGSKKTIADLKTLFNRHIREDAVHRANLNTRTYDSTGNYLTNCNQCSDCYHWEDSENCSNCMRGFKSKNSIDLAGSGDAELCGYGAMIFPGGYKTKLSMWTQNCRESEYIDLCIDCQYCFGCVGLRNKKYCIFNKQYSEEEYKQLKERIIANMKQRGEYGAFFPYNLAFGGYNLSTAQNYFPKTKNEVLSMNALWEEVEDTQDGTSPEELPDSIQETDDSISKKPLLCPQTKYRFNIAPHELAFYRNMSIPLPTTHPDNRVLERFSLLSVITPHSYACIFCNQKIDAYYPPKWGYKKIACIECYQKEIA